MFHAPHDALKNSSLREQQLARVHSQVPIGRSAGGLFWSCGCRKRFVRPARRPKRFVHALFRREGPTHQPVDSPLLGSLPGDRHVPRRRCAASRGTPESKIGTFSVRGLENGSWIQSPGDNGVRRRRCPFFSWSSLRDRHRVPTIVAPHGKGFGDGRERRWEEECSSRNVGTAIRSRSAHSMASGRAVAVKSKVKPLEDPGTFARRRC